jgi:Rrf2 family protein
MYTMSIEMIVIASEPIPQFLTISSKADYALRAVFDLASRSPGERVRIADIARRQAIPRKFLEAILVSLRQGGFVESRRGAEGGYRLARPPEAITVGEVLRFVEGSQPRNGFAGGYETPFGELWRGVDEAISNVIDATSFADLLRKWEENQRAYVPSWDI